MVRAGVLVVIPYQGSGVAGLQGEMVESAF